MNLELLVFVFNGLLGAVLRELLEDKKREKESIIKILIVGAISGYIYYLLHTEYNFPNGLMSIIFGYFSYDILPRIFRSLGGFIWQRGR
ncbi:MAG: hypothetical protein QW607_06245 [Desulfurococcaceae archaeon]